MSKTCDNLSVGVIIRDEAGNYALLERRKFPVGIAPAAGHVDNHGSHEQAALDEVQEELGIVLAPESLKKVIDNKHMSNQCSREGGSYHDWTVYEARITYRTLQPDADEAKGARWYTPEEVQALADKTKAYLEGEISEQAWTENPGLEDVWVALLIQLKHISSAKLYLTNDNY